MSPEQNKALVTSTLRAAFRLDLDAAAPNIADDLVWYLPKSVAPEVPIKGKKRFLEMTGGLKQMFPEGLQHTVRHAFCDGDTVVLEYNNKGKAANGKLYDNDYCTLFVLRNGQIKEIREYNDSSHAKDVFLS